MVRLKLSDLRDNLHNSLFYLIIVISNIFQGLLISVIIIFSAWIIKCISEFLGFQNSYLYLILNNGSSAATLAIFLIYSGFGILGVFKFMKKGESRKELINNATQELISSQENN